MDGTPADGREAQSAYTSEERQSVAKMSKIKEEYCRFVQTKLRLDKCAPPRRALPVVPCASIECLTCRAAAAPHCPLERFPKNALQSQAGAPGVFW